MFATPTTESVSAGSARWCIASASVTSAADTPMGTENPNGNHPSQHREHDEEHEPEPERGHRGQQEAVALHDAVHEPPPVRPGQDAEREAEHAADDPGRGHERKRVERARGDDVGHRRVVAQRRAQIALKRRRDPVDIALPEGVFTPQYSASWARFASLMLMSAACPTFACTGSMGDMLTSTNVAMLTAIMSSANFTMLRRMNRGIRITAIPSSIKNVPTRIPHQAITAIRTRA